MKIMTYNIRHGWGLDKLFGLKDILQIIKKHQPDIIGLNEVDVYNPRSLFVHQAKALAKGLQYHYAFLPNVQIGPIGYGNAILSKFPILEVKNHLLYSKGEQRGCLSVTLDILDDVWERKIKVLCTHLGLDVKERKHQISQIADIIKKIVDPIVLLGDFNCHHEELQPLKELLLDPLTYAESQENCCTYPVIRRNHRLDYIFHNYGLHAFDYKTIYSKASDHLPVLATLKLVNVSKNV